MAPRRNGFTFTWKIENFSCVPHQEGQKLKSAEFFVESVKKSRWCLWLYPRGKVDENGCGKDHISLFIQHMEPTPLTVFSCWALETADVKFEVLKLKKCPKLTFAKSARGNYKHISLESLYEKKHLYLPQDILTVKCFISPEYENDHRSNNIKLSIVPDPFRRQCFSITRIHVQRRSVTWPIKKISKLCKSRKATNTYYSNSALTNSPSLKLSFSISNDSDIKHAQIEILRMHSIEGRRLFVKCKITIFTADKTYQNSIEDSHLFSLELDDKWIFPSFIEIKNLTDDKNVLIDDTLMLHCDFAFSCLPGPEYLVEAPQYNPWHLEINKPSKENQLCRSIEDLYMSGDFCDVTLHADGKAFPAHKVVLCARSPVFSAMFQNDMKEKDTNVVDVSDVDAGTLERFLRFLHSDIVDEKLTCEEVSNLYKVAAKYQVDILKQKCSILFLSSLSVSSVCDVLVLAEAHDDHFLMTAVNNFLQYNSNETFNSKEWQDFVELHPKLSGIFMLKAWKSNFF